MQAALERLRADPSVCGKEAGRELLRWLSGHTVDIDDLPECAGVIPPHRVGLVAMVTRQTARARQEFARRVESAQPDSGTSLSAAPVE
jgi:hypothetical protein